MGTKVDIIERKTIKPSSPTPPHLRNVKLSLLDQIIPPISQDRSSKLSDFLGQPDTELLDHFVPTSDPTTAELAQGSIALIQLTGFQCGGTAVSVTTQNPRP
ncbi:Transferase [Trema orientale]|uniref:Transferase n=1 Tax=Trema orientale TaxID=63057 RepID=A0A2P5DE75_TREOI|nr:Transferase [Trema orientale]